MPFFYLLAITNFMLFFYVLGLKIGFSSIDYREDLREGVFFTLILVFGSAGTAGALAILYMLAPNMYQMAGSGEASIPGRFTFWESPLLPSFLELIKMLYVPLLSLGVALMVGIATGNWVARLVSRRSLGGAGAVGSGGRVVARQVSEAKGGGVARKDVFGFDVTGDGRIILRINKRENRG